MRLFEQKSTSHIVRLALTVGTKQSVHAQEERQCREAITIRANVQSIVILLCESGVARTERVHLDVAAPGRLETPAGQPRTGVNCTNSRANGRTPTKQSPAGSAIACSADLGPEGLVVTDLRAVVLEATRFSAAGEV